MPPCGRLAPCRSPVVGKTSRRSWTAVATSDTTLTKLGIFVHWTPASVAAFAPVDMEIGALLQSGRKHALAWSPYTEWYEKCPDVRT
jgi:hypothetical protein